MMSYYKGELPPSPIELLLNKLELAESQDISPDHQVQPDLPTLEQFLLEEDILRECRSDNEKLITYLCRPENIRDLLHKSFDVPAMLTEVPTANGSPPSTPDSSEDESEDPTQDLTEHDSNQQEESKEDTRFSAQRDRERRMKFAYVASELLTADNKQISEAIVENDAAMKRLFGLLEENESGSLNSIVASQFSKIVINLLKLKNLKVLEQMDKQDYNFMENVLKHVDSIPIAELVVRILDSPDPEPSYTATREKKPTDEALELLSKHSLLEGLATCFVKVSCGDIAKPGSEINLQERDGTSEVLLFDQETFEAGQAQRRRLKEETMSNVSMTILGVTDRLLQFPELGVRIPEKLSPYGTPSVIARLLDAGLYANCSGKVKEVTPCGEDFPDENAKRVEAFTKGNSSALIHSLGIAAELLTTQANVMRDDDAEGNHEDLGNRTTGIGIGHSPYSGKGIGPSLAAPGSSSEEQNENGDASEISTKLPELLDKKAGDPIVDTDMLQAELAVRFGRLYELFDDGDTIGTNEENKPLGSLRLKLAEFFLACTKKGSPTTVEQISNLGVPKKLLELFARYPWSSILHGVVTSAIVHSLEDAEIGRSARQAWLKAGLITWLVNLWRKSSEQETVTRGASAGYVGHLIRIGTALKGYLERDRNEPNADLPEETDPTEQEDFPEQTEMELFEVFADKALAPAYVREATPLCAERSDSDEGEEARDVLEMGGISLVGGFTTDCAARDTMGLKYAAFPSHQVIDDDEEIKTVEVDDLSHFGADEDDGSPTRAVDHDIPQALRDDFASTEISDSKASQGRNDVAVSSFSEYRSGQVMDSAPDEIAENDELKGAIDAVDSSSDEEGSYVAFVDDQRDSEDLTSITRKLEGAKIGGEATETSIAGAVTEIEEIEEPEPIGSAGPVLPSLASNVVSISDDDMNSSDEEYEAWEDASGPNPAHSLTVAPSEEPSTRSTSDTDTSRKVG